VAACLYANISALHFATLLHLAAVTAIAPVQPGVYRTSNPYKPPQRRHRRALPTAFSTHRALSVAAAAAAAAKCFRPTRSVSEDSYLRPVAGFLADASG
jgi:hypothetical protein